MHINNSVTELEKKISELGFHDIEIEFPGDEDTSYYVKVQFYWRWKRSPQDSKRGYQEFEGENENEILRNIQAFVAKEKDFEINIKNKWK